MRKLVACFLAVLMLLISPLTSLAESGEKAVASCVACHGVKGNSQAPIFPKLAGQNKKYLSKQLYDYQLNHRKNPTMQGMAAALSDKDIEAIASYYAAQTIQQIALPAADPDEDEDDDEDEDEESEADSPINHAEQIKMGEMLYTSGNLETQVPACGACHAPDARGNSLAGFPALRSQHVTYLVSTLKQYREGERQNDAAAMMRKTAKRMSSEEINAVSAYLADLK